MQIFNFDRCFRSLRNTGILVDVLQSLSKAVEGTTGQLFVHKIDVNSISNRHSQPKRTSEAFQEF